MLKGCQRRIIMVKDTGSPCFDAAYFVLRNSAPQTLTKTDMLAEASRVIDACSVAGCFTDEKAAPAKKRRHAASILLFLVSAGLGLIAGAAATLLCCLP